MLETQLNFPIIAQAATVAGELDESSDELTCEIFAYDYLLCVVCLSESVAPPR